MSAYKTNAPNNAYKTTIAYKKSIELQLLRSEISLTILPAVVCLSDIIAKCQKIAFKLLVSATTNFLIKLR